MNENNMQNTELNQETPALSQQDIHGVLAETKKTVRTHGREIESIHRVDAEQMKKDAEHDSLIAQSMDKNAQQDDLLKRQQEMDRLHDQALKQVKGISVAALITAAAALILSVLQFFL